MSEYLIVHSTTGVEKGGALHCLQRGPEIAQNGLKVLTFSLRLRDRNFGVKGDKLSGLF